MRHKKCKWLESQDGFVFDTECGNKFEFIDSGIEDNGFKFCPYCGEKIFGEVKS